MMSSLLPALVEVSWTWNVRVVNFPSSSFEPWGGRRKVRKGAWIIYMADPIDEYSVQQPGDIVELLEGPRENTARSELLVRLTATKDRLFLENSAAR